MADVRRADLVVLLTSSSDSLLESEHLKSGAVVLDDTVPRNTDPALLITRPDVLIVDGGARRCQRHHAFAAAAIGLPRGLAYACLAETMLLALDEHEGHFAIGAATVDQAERMVALADRWRELGFTLAPVPLLRPHHRSEPALAGRWQPREVIECAA